jgi:hypothetical protein
MNRKPVFITAGGKAFTFAATGEVVYTDAADADILRAHSWSMHGTSRGYPAAGARGKFVFLHHLILGRPPTGLEMDHVNGNPCDARRANLRWVTHAENLRNCKVHRAGQPFGVTRRRNGRWSAQRYDGSRLVHLGCYDTAAEASAVSLAWRPEP